MGIGRRCVDQDRIEGQRTTLEQVGNLGQEHRHVIGPSIVDRGPRVGTHEQRPVPEVAGHRGSQVGAWTLGMEMDHAHVAQLGRPGHQRIEQD